MGLVLVVNVGRLERFLAFGPCIGTGRHNRLAADGIVGDKFVRIECVIQIFESGTKLPDGIDDAIHRSLFHVPFRYLAGQAEEVEHVRVFCDLLCKLTIGRGQLPGEIIGTSANTFPGLVHDLVHQHIS
jgi:hypothetical protein